MDYIMKKYFILFALIIGCFWDSFSQYTQTSEAFRTDSTRLDSLKKILPLSIGSGRVDLLNEISIKTPYNVNGNARDKIDTCIFYASLAYVEAIKLGYKSGIAMALLQLHGIESVMNQPVADVAIKEKHIREAIRLAEEVNDNEVLGWAYYYLGSLPSVNMDFNKYIICSEKSIYHFQKAGDIIHEAEVTNWLVDGYSQKGEYEKAFDYARKSVELSKKSGTDFSMNWKEFLVQYSLGSMADLYTIAGDYQTAIAYSNLSFASEASIAGLLGEMGKYDSALFYWNRWRKSDDWSNSAKGHQAWGNGIRGKIYLNANQYDKAIEIFKNCSDTLKKYHPLGIYAAINYILLAGQAYDGKKDYTTALEYAKKGFCLAQDKNQRLELMKGSKILSSIYHHLGNNDSAYVYLLKYNILKDSIQNRQFLLRLDNYKGEIEVAKKEALIGLLNTDNKMKQQQIRQEATIEYFLIGIIFTFILIGIFVNRNLRLKRRNDVLAKKRVEGLLKVQQLESEKKHSELQHQATKLEMQALRAQMNPHFIFNSLSSINRFILKNETDAASDYLTRFSRLIRMVLINSEKSIISLEDELEMLRLYLDMERLRFKDSFDYAITSSNSIDAGTIFLPPLLLQPFCENAIWHGLMQKDGKGLLEVSINMQDKILHCTITDNGIGRERALETKSRTAEKEKSLGLKITTQRLALLNKEHGPGTSYKIEDLYDENNRATGTKVTLQFNCDIHE